MRTNDNTIKENKQYLYWRDKFINYFNEHSSNDFEIYGNYINTKNPIKIRHKKCQFEFDINPAVYYKNNGICHCPKCKPDSTKRCIPYANDIYTTRPDVYELLLNKEDGHKYKSKTHKSLWFVCPICGKHIFSNCCNVSTYGLICSNCNNRGLSYPERFMKNILTSLNIDFISQFKPEWIYPYRYDFMFNYNNNKYIIEMDGKFHYIDNNMSGFSTEEAVKRDLYKDSMALKNGYTIIRINCNYKNLSKRYNFIVNNIMESQLSSIFDFSNIDFKTCDINSTENILKVVANKWNSGYKSVQQLVEIFNIPYSTMHEYIYKISDLGFISESKDEIKRNNNNYRKTKYGYYNSIKVKCNETGEIFNSISEADKKYNSYLWGYFKRGYKTSGKLSDGTRLTWTKLN